MSRHNETLPHLRLVGTEQPIDMTSRRGGGGEYQVPPRDRGGHGNRLRQELGEARRQIEEAGHIDASGRCHVTYELVEDGHKVIDSLRATRSKIRLEAAVETDSGWSVVVSMPIKKFPVIDRLLQRYLTEETEKGRAKGETKVTRIETIRATIEEDLWTDYRPLPGLDEARWWEVWLSTDELPRSQAGKVAEGFWTRAQNNGFTAPVTRRFLHFPDRVVVLVRGTLRQWQEDPVLLIAAAELRAGKSIAADYFEVEPTDSGDMIRDVAEKLPPPPTNAAAVCLLDTGVRANHPLLKPLIETDCVQTIDPKWSVTDSGTQHGTAMAGVAGYYDLAPVLDGTRSPPPSVPIESVRIVGPSTDDRTELYGRITEEAVAAAAAARPKRNRVICITSTTGDPVDGPYPSSWSAAIDQSAAGCSDVGASDRQLYVVAGGNLREEILRHPFEYPTIDPKTSGIEDPGQSWNALTVGAITDKIDCGSGFDAYQAIARPGQLSPTSRTSHPWALSDQSVWPIKPDLVFEGGNWATNNTSPPVDPDGLGILTTHQEELGGRLLTVTRDTSPATAAVAGMAARLWTENPGLRPETIRGLLVHTARWDQGSESQMPCSGDKKLEYQKRLRCFGYGRPDFARANNSVRNDMNLIYEGELQPFKEEGTATPTNQMHLHQLPWPTKTLNRLGSTDVEMRVTLSYFIEPSPGRRGWGRAFRYASHGLRFDVVGPTDTPESLVAKHNKQYDEHRADDVGVGDRWTIGDRSRVRGSLHSDWWCGTAAELAACNCLVVYPVSGWWRERKGLKRVNSPARYSLIISLSTADATADLYAEVVSEVTVQPIIDG